MAVEDQTLHGSSRLLWFCDCEVIDQVGVQPVGSTWERRHESPGSGRSCQDGKYFIFVQVDVPSVAFKGSGKGFAGGLSCPSDKVNVDVVESYGGVGVVDRGYGRTCRWGRAGDPLLEGAATLHFGAASRQASIAGSGSSVCVEARALMIGMLSSGRERLSGQWRPACVGDSGRKWVLHPDDVGAVDQSGVGSESDRYWCPF
jgi:hypothetical protein